MKEVTLYTTNKQQVMSYGMDYVTQHKYMGIPNLIPVRGSDQFLDKQEIEVHQLPVQRFCWGDGREVFAAFDRDLLEIIGCSQDKFKADVQKATDRRVQSELKDLLIVKENWEELNNKSFWKKVLWCFNK